ncbi:MAG: hypothetical protein EXR57_03580 [Dehalococcoidia bacterium]|nr:hypothetical protein [Dehalococcoidia bacterium]
MLARLPSSRTGVLRSGGRRPVTYLHRPATSKSEVNSMSKIYDAHAYLGNNKGWGAFGLPVPFDGPHWVKYLDYCGFDGVLVAPPGVGAGEDFKPDMDRIADAMKRYPGRFYGFCRLKPRRGKAALEELKRRHGQGFKAVKFNTLDDNYTLADRSLLDPVLETADKLGGMTMYFHTGDRHGATCQPSMVGNMAADFPDMTFMIGHCGYPGWTDQIVPTLLRNPNTVCETAGVFNPFIVQGIIDATSADRVLLGSNGPNSPIEIARLFVQKYLGKLTPAEKAKVAGGNFERWILKIKPAASKRPAASGKGRHA